MASETKFVRGRVPLLLAAGLLLAVVASNCTRSECQLPAHFTLKSDQAVLYETWDRVPHEWGPGEEVTIDWQAGVFLVNGFAHLPHDGPPPWKVETLRKLYGRVPFVLNYVGNAEGDSVTRWNAASEALHEMHREIYTGGRRIYQAALDSLGTSESAMDAAAAWIEQSEHVDSTARYDDYMSRFSPRRERKSPTPMLMVFWKGDPYGTSLDLSEHHRSSGRSGRTYKDPCPREDVCSVVLLMRMAFSRPGAYRVEFVRGNVNMFGPAGVQYSTGGPRSTDSTFHYNPYVEAIHGSR
jgi:hypothetical protein